MTTTIDFSKTGRRKKRRSKRDLARFWNSRYKAFIKAGFTPEEAEAGANDGLSLRNKTVKRIIRLRKARVSFFMKDYGWSRAAAIAEASKDLETKLENAGQTEISLYYELSPKED